MLSILAFCTLECWWLVQKYEMELDATCADMSAEIVNAADEIMSKRTWKLDENDNNSIKVTTNVEGGTTKYSGYVVAHRHIGDLDPAAYASVIAELVESGRADETIVDVIKFNDIEVEDADINTFTEALSRVRANIMSPFDPALMKAAVDSATGLDCRVDTLKMPGGRVWKAYIEPPANIFSRELRLTYPHNPLEGGAAVVTVDVPLQSALSGMALTFAVLLIVAILLITCLLCQLSVIHHQHKIADLQKGYTLTMLHELKRPLSSLKLLLSFLRNPKLTEDDRREAMSNASRETDNLATYFNKLRAITYNEASEIPLVPTSFPLSKAVDDSIAQQPDRCRIRKAGTEEITITAERQGVVNAICNLLENALKYTPDEVVIDWCLRNHDVEITVSDKGAGISDSDKKRIFDRFYRVAESAEAPGMGLGLTYVRQVAEAHGGSITVADNPGGGTIFLLKIPQI